MNKKLLLIIFSFAFTNIYSQDSFRVSGVVLPALGAKKAYLIIKSNDQRKIIHKDSSAVINGSFKISGMLSEPSQNATLRLETVKKSYTYDFVLDSGINNIKPVWNNIDEGSRGIMQSETVSNAIKNKIDSIKRKSYRDYATKEGITGGFALPKEENHRQCVEILSLLKKYPDNYYSLISLFILSKSAIMYDYPEEIIETFNEFSIELKSSALGRELIANKTGDIKAKLNAIEGHLAPVFTALDVNNYEFTNNSFTKYPYLIVFSATWCIPCQKQLPALQSLYSKYNKNGLKIIYISLDKDFEKWKKHIRQNPKEWINISDASEYQKGRIGKLYHVSAVPTYILVNQNGIISYNSDTMDPDLSKIEKYVEQTISLKDQ
ncbi:TlpA disulfide reductase family protein [Pedobacter jejuensis]|uniref:AhpC/TSA family protein n=1 Tax=Pedobacter jejuensis TaxID=1268550 RepID=A0A3N0C060_9SPHI|nr:TlpA disulfide reductase family protein [Pedobacter jejuensis]RNL55407.1 AhpC/TSA family protein [Pedobacter jejuensis]